MKKTFEVDLTGHPAEVKIVDGYAVMAIPMSYFKNLIETDDRYAEYTDGEDDVDFIYPRVVDEAVWMEEVVDWMNFEGDDGTTLITDVIERAFVEAIESGSATIDLP